MTARPVAELSRHRTGRDTPLPVIKQGRRVPSDLPEVLAQKIVQAGQTLLTLIGEIKRNALVSDFAARNADVAALRDRLAAQQAASEHELQRVMARIAAVTQVCITRSRSLVTPERLQ